MILSPIEQLACSNYSGGYVEGSTGKRTTVTEAMYENRYI